MQQRCQDFEKKLGSLKGKNVIKVKTFIKDIKKSIIKKGIQLFEFLILTA